MCLRYWEIRMNREEEGAAGWDEQGISRGGPRCHGKTSLDYDGDRGDGNDTRMEIHFGDKSHQD